MLLPDEEQRLIHPHCIQGLTNINAQPLSSPAMALGLMVIKQWDWWQSWNGDITNKVTAICGRNNLHD